MNRNADAAATRIHEGPVSGVPRWSWITLAAALCVVLLLGVLNWTSFERWRHARSDVARIDEQTAQTDAEWKALELRLPLLTNRPLVLCNLTVNNVIISDVTAIYEKDGSLKRFSSQDCSSDWENRDDARFPAGGEKRLMHFSSANRDCDWSGDFLFASVGWYSYLPSGEPIGYHTKIVHPLLLAGKECLSLEI